MRLILIIFSAILFSPNCIAQKAAKVSDKVRLIRAKSEDCDITMDVTRLKEGYDLEYTDSSTIFTVHFADDCCSKFKPSIAFKNNRLLLRPYTIPAREMCKCICCFTIRYEVAGLKDKKYLIYFRGDEVKLISNHSTH